MVSTNIALNNLIIAVFDDLQTNNLIKSDRLCTYIVNFFNHKQ